MWMAGGILLMHEQPFDVISPFNALVSVELASAVLRVLAGQGLQCVALKPAAANPLKRWILRPQAAAIGDSGSTLACATL